MKSTYDRYKELVQRALASGYTYSQVAAELSNEKKNIQAAAKRKVSQLAMDRNPYPRREAMRAAQECQMVIDRILKEVNELAKGAEA